MDRKILKSSIYRLGTAVEFKVWTHLLLVANPRDGSVSDEVWLMASEANLSVEEFNAALKTLAGPDDHSRTKTDEGRRIRIDPNGKIFLINYLSHRDKDHSTTRTRAWRERKGTVRNGTKRSGTVGNGVERSETPLGTTDTDTITTDTETDNEPPAAAPRAKSGSWSEQACDDWIERHGGTAPGGQIARHLKPLVDRYGWETARLAWRAYLYETEAQYANPARFAATFGTWNKLPALSPGHARERAAAAVPPQDGEAMSFFVSMRDKLKGEMNAQAWATWIRGAEGWVWEDDGRVLVLAVPGQPHAEMLRGTYADTLRSAAAELGKSLKFKVFVRQEEQTLHNGSVR